MAYLKQRLSEILKSLVHNGGLAGVAVAGHLNSSPPPRSLRVCALPLTRFIDNSPKLPLHFWVGL